jgi:hypothetical protein
MSNNYIDFCSKLEKAQSYSQFLNQINLYFASNKQLNKLTSKNNFNNKY